MKPHFEFCSTGGLHRCKSMILPSCISLGWSKALQVEFVQGKDVIVQVLHPWRSIFLSIFSQDRKLSQSDGLPYGLDIATTGTRLGARLKEHGLLDMDWREFLATTLHIDREDLPILPQSSFSIRVHANQPDSIHPFVSSSCAPLLICRITNRLFYIFRTIATSIHRQTLSLLAFTAGDFGPFSDHLKMSFDWSQKWAWHLWHVIPQATSTISYINETSWMSRCYRLGVGCIEYWKTVYSWLHRICGC